MPGNPDRTKSKFHVGDRVTVQGRPGTVQRVLRDGEVSVAMDDNGTSGIYLTSSVKATQATLVDRLRQQRDVMESVYVLRQINPQASDGMYYSQKHSGLLTEAANRIEYLEKREAYLVAELNCLGGMDLNGDKDGLE